MTPSRYLATTARHQPPDESPFAVVPALSVVAIGVALMIWGTVEHEASRDRFGAVCAAACLPYASTPTDHPIAPPRLWKHCACFTDDLYVYRYVTMTSDPVSP